MLKHRKAGGSALGLTLVAMLVFAAFGVSAAQASSWHIGGNSFSGEEGVVSSGGPIEISRPDWEVTIACETLTGAETIKESSKSTGTITLSECAVQGMPQCNVQPLTLGFNGNLVDSGGQTYERYNVDGKWTINGEYCYLFESPYVQGSIAAAVGVPDAVHSPRVFSSAAESATGASGLNFALGSWQVSGNATASLAGKNAGKDFGIGIGGTWKPEPATWTIGGSPFGGSEEFLWSEESEPIEIGRPGGPNVRCDHSGTYYGAEISGGDESSAEVLLYGCSISTAPKCNVGDVYLTLNGQIGREGSDVLEKADAGGEWEMSGSGCPFTGARQISGSVGDFLESEGATLRRYFLGETSDSEVKATGLQVNGEMWQLAAIVGSTLYGANGGEEFGVE